MGSLSKRVERRERVGDVWAGRGPEGETVRREGEGEGDGLLLNCGDTGGDARPGECGRVGGCIFLLPNGLRAGLGEGGGLCLLMDARGEEGGDGRRIEALGEPGGLRRIIEARGEWGGDGCRAMGGGDL